MNVKYITTFSLLIIAMVAWQVFLIQRDTKMFDAYENRQQQICQQLKSSSLDCLK